MSTSRMHYGPERLPQSYSSDNMSTSTLPKSQPSSYFVDATPMDSPPEASSLTFFFDTRLACLSIGILWNTRLLTGPLVDARSTAGVRSLRPERSEYRATRP
ncbi:hypothetical protein BN1708_006775, partial [Verticillium longisporum]